MSNGVVLNNYGTILGGSASASLGGSGNFSNYGNITFSTMNIGVPFYHNNGQLIVSTGGSLTITATSSTFSSNGTISGGGSMTLSTTSASSVTFYVYSFVTISTFII